MADDNLQTETIRTNWQAAWELHMAAKKVATAFEHRAYIPAQEKVAAGETLAEWDDLNDRMEHLNDEAYAELAVALAETPAPDRAALEWKIDYLFGDAGEYCDSIRMTTINAFLADVRRLLP